MTKPRIALPIPTSFDDDYNRKCWPQYASAIAEAGGEAIELPLRLPLADLQQRIAACDGLCLPGSPADVDPALYGAETDSHTAPADPAREAFDRAALDHAVDTAKPVLGICYGTQFLNVWRGGTLVQDLANTGGCRPDVNHSAGPGVPVAHPVGISDSSKLATILDGTEMEQVNYLHGAYEIQVNSSHHQAVADVGVGLRKAASCPQDLVTEAVEADPDILPMPLLGVQWHPERSMAISAASRAIFTWLVNEAAKRREHSDAGTL